ncbi:protein ALP1-like [Lytechinus variegatus]|uniref:protein ALP1-like n=1 Tax=Lytechinus variegatus TaxID=7654 RepID=UPI001BB11651|nr:protein ALP1-like [Lytechinus variegatus]
MSKTTFEYLAAVLRPVLEKEKTNFGTPINYRRRLAAANWWLATPCEYRTVSTLFGMGISTICYIIRDVCHGVNSLLFQRYISLPSGARLDETIEGFEVRGFPQCAGAIDVIYLFIRAYPNKSQYLCCCCSFTDIYIGWPGRTHDARVLSHSDVFLKAEDDQGGYLFPHEVNISSTYLFSQKTLNFLLHKLIYFFFTEKPYDQRSGNPSLHNWRSCLHMYPFKNWLMKAFTNNHQLTRQQAHFNFRLSSARMVVENAFGRLKGRWRRLLKRLDVETGFASDVVTTCCVLHSICEIHKDQYDEAWDREWAEQEAADRLQQPQGIQDIGGNVPAGQIRNTIMNML